MCPVPAACMAKLVALAVLASPFALAEDALRQRWDQLKRDISLLREQVVTGKPGKAEALLRLARLYRKPFKRGEGRASRYCKLQLAGEMKRVFGPILQRELAPNTPPPTSTEQWQRIASGALTPAKLAAQIGEEKYAEFSKILARQGENGKGWTFDEFERAFRESPDGLIPEIVRQELVDLGIAIPVDLALRHRWLLNHYRLKPELVAHINRTLGDLDWRLPEAHAIYWATLAYREWRKSGDELKARRCERMILESLHAALRGGSLVASNVWDTEVLETRPNLNVVDSCRKAYEDYLAKYGEGTIRGAYGDFLVDAVVCLYKDGFRARAKEYFAIARKRCGSRVKGDLDTLVLKEIEAEIKAVSYNRWMSAVQGYVIHSCFSLANRRHEESAAYERTAKSVYDWFDRRGRGGFAPYSQLKANAIRYCLETFPPELSAALRRELERQAVANGRGR
jgi:hypothetical protein